MGYLYRPKLKNGKPARIWWVKYYVNGNPIRESTGTERETEAKRFLKVREGRVAMGQPVLRRMDRIRYEEAAEDLRKHYRTTGCRSLREAEIRLNHLDRFFRHTRLASIDHATITRYVETRQQAGAGNATINREIGILGRMLRLAYEGGKLFRVPSIKLLKEPPPRKGFFEKEAFQAVLRRLPEEIRPVATFAYITGWRVPSEVLPLTWAQVEFVGGVVRLEPGTTKNQDGRTFPLFSDLRELLERQRVLTREVQIEQDRIIPWVFHRKGKPILSFRKSWATACRLAGQPGRIPHDLRRTAVRDIVRKGIPERVAMQLSGHKTRSVFERYNIVSEGDLREAGKKLTGTFSGTSAPIVVDSQQVNVQNYTHGPVAQTDRAEVS